MEHHEIIKKFRILRGLTQKEVAEKLGMTHSGYSKYERGERKMDILKYAQICSILDAPRDLGEIDEEHIFLNYRLDYHMKLQEVVETFYERKDVMTSDEKKVAKEMFEKTYYNIQDAKQQIIKELKKISTIDEEIDRFDLQFLYND